MRAPYFVKEDGISPQRIDKYTGFGPVSQVRRYISPSFGLNALSASGSAQGDVTKTYGVGRS
jgi:hypothetical protein